MITEMRPKRRLVKRSIRVVKYDCYIDSDTQADIDQTQVLWLSAPDLLFLFSLWNVD